MDSNKDKTIGFIEKILTSSQNREMDNIVLYIKKLVPKSLDVFRDILDNDEIGLDYKFKVAKYILDLSPVGKELAQAKAPHVVTTMIRDFSVEQLAELKSDADSILDTWKQNYQTNKKETD